MPLETQTNLLLKPSQTLLKIQPLTSIKGSASQDEGSAFKQSCTDLKDRRMTAAIQSLFAGHSSTLDL